MRKFYIQKTVFIFTLVFLSGAYSAFATPVPTWNNNSGDNKWSTASNWSTGALPATNSTVSIPTGFTVNVDTTVTVSSISMTGNSVLNINNGKSLTTGGNLTLNVSGSNKPTVNLKSGTLVIGANLSGGGTINGNTGTLNLKGSTSSSSTFVPGTSTVIIGGSSSQSSITFTSFYNLQVKNASGFTIASGSTVSGSITGTGKLIGPGPGTGLLSLKGDMAVSTFTPGSLKIRLTGSKLQHLNGYTIYWLEIDNDSGAILNGDITINSYYLVFSPSTGGYSGPSPLYLNGHYLTLGSAASISYANTTNGFIVPGTGHLSMYVKSIGTTFPIGTSDSTYTPVTIRADASTNVMVGLDNTLSNEELTAVKKHGVNATWNFTPLANATGFAATIQWNSGQELTSFDRDNIYVYYRTSQSSPTSWTQLGSLSSASGSGPYTVTGNQMSVTADSTYYFSVADKNIALPVELISFSANNSNGKNILEWNTASELNNDHFEVQRFDESKNWTAIAEIPGHGTTNQEQFYSYTDGSVQTSNIVYYRLKQVDHNGKFEYSEIKRISCEQKNKTMKIFPNPARDVINLSFVNDGLIRDVKIFDMQGTCVYSYKNASYHNTIDISSLKNGIYFLKTYSGNDVSSQVFCKE